MSALAQSRHVRAGKAFSEGESDVRDAWALLRRAIGRAAAAARPARRTQGEVQRIHVGTGVGGGLGPADRALKVGGIGGRLAEGDGEGLRILGRQLRDLPFGDIAL